ncbi:hypothetical protein HDU77_008109 [Chytriomyces hyalinus]|nr:hypothetical protein HDU77_008109 [Chytriomyces hyalinus]
MIAIALLVAATASLEVSAWGSLGHSTTGEIAQRHLSPNAKAMVSAMLMPEFMKSLGGKTPNWADNWRTAHPETASWHFINYKYEDGTDNPQTCGYIPAPTSCTGTGCVLTAITNQTAVLLNNKCSISNESTLAVQYLTHFLGDITQPLHNCFRDLGGNKAELMYKNKKSNFHSIHDTAIPEQYAAEVGINATDYSSLATHIISKYGDLKANATSSRFIDLHTLRDGFLSAAVEMSTEGNLYLCEKSLFWTLYDANPKQDFSGAYYQATKDVLNAQIAKAGFRIAAWFNKIADECAPSTSTSASTTASTATADSTVATASSTSADASASSAASAGASASAATTIPVVYSAPAPASATKAVSTGKNLYVSSASSVVVSSVAAFIVAFVL